MIDIRSWRDPDNGIIHQVTIDAYRCPSCGQLHVRGGVTTDCGIDLSVVHDEHEQVTCVACLEAAWLDEQGERLGTPAWATAPARSA